MHENELLSQFHSVHLQEDMCKGCTICVTGCPVEAIRVRDGKAHILEKRCIDCGECIRHCPSKAKYSLTSTIDELASYTFKAALITPSIYGQFNMHYSKQQIHNAFKSLGFTHVYDVSEDALTVSRATAYFLTHEKNLPKPIISSSCPTIVKLIEVRFPSLLDNILPLLPPVELCARRARADLQALAKADNSVGVFLIAPCSAKITVARSPVGYDKTAMDGAFAFEKLYLPLVTALRKMRSDEKQVVKEIAEELVAVKVLSPEERATKIPKVAKFYTDAPDGLAWGRESGEAEYVAHFLEHPENFNWITACGIQQVIETLEAIEDGQMNQYDFAELDACAGGCINGPLMIKPASEGLAVMRNRLRFSRAARDKVPVPDLTAEDIAAISLTNQISPRPARQLSGDFVTARKMMQNMEDIVAQLPGLDCGSCGAPNCRALAEDIVRHRATLEDCVTIMKSRYEELLFGNKH